MAATVQIREMTAVTTGYDKTSSTIRFKAANATTVTTANPVVVPAGGHVQSYTKAIRPYCLAAPSVQINNIRWYTSGSGTFGTGISCAAKNNGNTFVSHYTAPMTSATTLFKYTSAAPLDGDGTDSDGVTATGATTYFGDMIYLQLNVASNATQGAKTAQTITLSFDEV